MNIEGFCNNYNLGKVLNIKKLTGGLMHQMYKVKTSNNVYAIKVLNREVISRLEAYANFVTSENISNYLALNHIRVSNALKINNNYLNKYEEDYYMVFNFVNGKVLKDEEITIKHCAKIASVLAQIHNLDYSELNLIPKITKYTEIYDWSSYLKNPNFNKMPYQELYLDNYLKYASLQQRANERFNNINKDYTLSHQDLDPKNVMWQDNEPILIDFEAATISCPYQELLEVALCWSGFLNNIFSEEKFTTFIKTYLKERPLPDIDWYDVICGNLINRFNWLNYNLKRSLGLLTKDEAEISLATNEVTKTINEINRYIDIIGPLTDIVESVNSKTNYDSLITKIIANTSFLSNTDYQYINSGFTNTIYKVGEYIVRICTNNENEESFNREITFYQEHPDISHIPKLYLADTSKKIIPYIYEIISYLDGPTIYEIWPNLDEKEKVNIINEITTIIKNLHSIPVQSFEFSQKIKEELTDLLNQTNIGELFDLNPLLDKCSIYFKDNIFGLIHHDLHFDNFIYHNQEVYLIDFEQVRPYPIDYDFKIFYRMQKEPWKWASIKTDMLTIPNDYHNLMSYFKKSYSVLNTINYLDERLQIYTLIDLLQEYSSHTKEEIKDQIISLLTSLKILIKK